MKTSENTYAAARITADQIGELAEQGVKRALNTRRMAELNAREIEEVSGGASGYGFNAYIINGIPWDRYAKFGAVSLNPQPLPPKEVFTAGF